MSFRRSLRDILGLDKIKSVDRRFFERLLDAIDLRLKPIENSKADYDTAVGEVQTVALERINNVLTPAIEHIQTVQDKGFLLAHSPSNVALLDGETLVFQIDSEAERSLFTPSPFLSITREANATDIGIARRIGWDAISGDLTVQIETALGDGLAHDDWVISATAGVAEAQRSMLDEVRVKHGEVTTKSGEVSTKHGETLLAATVAVDAKDAAETAAENAATFDPDSYYSKGETYNQTELDDALEAKVDSSDLVPYFQNMEVFTSSGTFTPPAGVDRVYALIVNGGRGGNNGTAYIAGRAGSGGSSVAGFVDVSSPVTVTIGAGGGAQTNGGISEFDGKSTSSPPSNALTLSGQNGGGYNADGYPGGASGHGTGQYGRGGIGGKPTASAGNDGIVVVMW